MELPKIKMDGETYYIDKRLSEIRNVNNFTDVESVSLELIEYWEKNKIIELWKNGIGKEVWKIRNKP